ncbi:MAG: 3-hydroxy-3-methylglutaryl-CoA reductase, partial [Thermoplasmata archaeon]|nr:3-hydroxy-3-methylglutaryl-CoA reductase [Thermoplasmata archaeon]
MARTSRVEGFYKLSIPERLKILKEFATLTDDEVNALAGTNGLRIEVADKMIENAVGTFSLPLGIATNFVINGKDSMIPMVIEEPSVVAAASNSAKMARETGGFTTSSTPPIMIGQIQITNLDDPDMAAKKILDNKAAIIDLANKQDTLLISLGGGAKDMDVRVLQ